MPRVQGQFMADFSYDSYHGDEDSLLAPAKVRQWARRAGAAVSVALVLGLVAWAWQIALRDARGVPLIRAEVGAMRMAPEDPGGDRMAHQGLAVNNVAAVGEVADPAERLMLAPKPVELSADDPAGYAPMPPSAVVPTLTPTILAAAQSAEEGTSTSVLDGDAALIELEPEAGVPEALAAEAAPQEPEAVVTQVMSDAVAVAVAELVAADPEPVAKISLAAMVTSPRPVARPVRAGAVVVPEAEAAPAVLVMRDGANLAPGTRLVQLGAYDDEAAARLDWQRLEGVYEAYFKGKEPVIQKAVGGGKTFFRLRALGFADEDAARRFCSVLLNDRAPCIPVRVR